MPTTQKSPQKQTKATQKVGGSAKKPVTKAMEGGKGKVASVKSKAATRGGGSAKGVMPWNKKSTENANNIIELKGKISNIEDVVISNINRDISNIEEAIPKLVKMIRFIYNVNCENLKKEYPGNFMLRELAETVMDLEIVYGKEGTVYRPRSVRNKKCDLVDYPYRLSANSPKET
jgi:hypothetical protein